MIRLIPLFALLLIMSCSEPIDKIQNGPLAGELVVNGDPGGTTGARWSYTEAGKTPFSIEGILYKPAGDGPFPAVIISHGTGGSVRSYSTNIAKEMVKWGLVCIATNYTHASPDVACGVPGSCEESAGEWGASESNIARGMKCWSILSSFPYVDTTRIAAFGHSRGAFVTTALAGTHPGKFSAVAHTAGGVSPSPGGSQPTLQMVEGITSPYLMHHGDNDNTVHISMDTHLAALLSGRSVTNVLYTYPGYTHSQIAMDAEMFARTRAWFETHMPK